MSSVNQLNLLIPDKLREQESHALVYDDGKEVITYSYKSMFRTSDEIKRRILAVCGQNEVIGICALDNPFVISVIIGILEASCIFYNFEPSGLRFVSHVIENFGVRTLLVQKEHIKTINSLLSQYDGETVETGGPFFHTLNLVLVRLRKVPPRSHDPGLAYCITTSGTTGVPKVVMVPHRCITPNMVHLREIYNVVRKDVVLMSSPLTFDPSIVEIFVTLMSGACLVMLPHRVKQSPNTLLDVLVRNNVSIIQATPSLISRMPPAKLTATILSDDTSLRILALGGENFPPVSTINSWRSEHNMTTFINLYGVTEVSCWATFYIPSQEDLQRSTMRVPLGIPLQDTEVKVKDDQGHIIQKGIGELFVGGKYRICEIYPSNRRSDSSDDYLVTTGDIVEMTEEGHMFYIGRKDSQIKRNGKRINLTQIENVLLKTDCISWCKAVLHYQRLFIFYTLRYKGDDNGEIEVNSYRSPRYSTYVEATLKETLPSHYWPDGVRELDTVPITHHGKCDIEALQKIIENDRNICFTGDLVTEMQNMLKCILRLEDIDKAANFLELGGNSLLAVQFLSSMESSLDQNLTDLLDILLEKTIGDVEIYLKCKLKEKKNISDDSLGKADILQCDNTPAVGKELGANKRINQRNNHYEEYIAEKEGENLRKRRRLDSKISTHLKSSFKATLHEFDCLNSPSLYSVRRGNLFQQVKNMHSISSESDTELCTNCHLLRGGLYSETSSASNFHMRELWKHDTGKCVDASPLVVKLSSGLHAVFIGSHSHKFCAVVMETGETLWETTLGDRVESSACLSYCGCYIVVGCYDGGVYVMDIDTGNIYWKYQTGAEVKSSPTVDPVTSLVIIGSHDKHLYALDSKSRTCRWRVYLGGGSIFSSPCVSTSPHQVIAGTLTGLIVSIQPISGEILWKYDAQKPVFSSPVYTCLGPCVGCVDGCVCQLDNGGDLIWIFKTNSPIFSSPTVIWMKKDYSHVDEPAQTSKDLDIKSKAIIKSTLVDNRIDYMILIGSHDCHVYCLGSNGNLLWKVLLDSYVYSTPFGFFLQPCSRGSCSNNYETIKVPSEISSALEEPNKCRIHTNEFAAQTNFQSWHLCERCFSFSEYCTVASSKGTLYMVDLQTGNMVSHLSVPGEVFSSPVVVGNHLVVGCRNDFVYCFRLESELVNVQ